VETVTLRFFNVYGPRQDPSSPYAAVIPIFLAKLDRGEPLPICGDGSQTRDFTYVGDVVRGLLRAAEVPGLSGRVFNLAGGKPVSVLDLARAMAPGTTPAFLPPRKGDILHSYADPTAVRQALGFVPETSLQDGLTATLKWFRDGS
jgi:UDP-glucose 4-epimerase